MYMRRTHTCLAISINNVCNGFVLNVDDDDEEEGVKSYLYKIYTQPRS